MSVRPEFVGRTGQCPRCRQPVTVPPQSQTTPPRNPPSSGGGPVASPPPPGHPGATQPYERRQAPPSPPSPPPPPGSAHYPGGPAVAAPPARLEVVHGPSELLGQVFPLPPGRPAVIGRDPSVDITIKSDRVSRRHCQLDPVQGGYRVQDLGSSNGTLVNQGRLQGPQELRGGEYIQTGDCLFRFQIG